MVNETKETKGTATTEANTGDGNKSGADSIIERADQARKGLELENQRLEQNIRILQELRAREIMGGTSEAGSTQSNKKEISEVEYAKLALQNRLPE